jgi:hypothetical protein
VPAKCTPPPPKKKSTIRHQWINKINKEISPPKSSRLSTEKKIVKRLVKLPIPACLSICQQPAYLLAKRGGGTILPCVGSDAALAVKHASQPKSDPPNNRGALPVNPPGCRAGSAPLNACAKGCSAGEPRTSNGVRAPTHSMVAVASGGAANPPPAGAWLGRGGADPPPP